MEINLDHRIKAFQKVGPISNDKKLILYHLGFVIFSLILYGGLIFTGFLIHQYILILLASLSIILMIGLIAAYGSPPEKTA